MATEAQIDANRRNARKSTGPRTQEGKQRSRQNAFQHGLTAETVITVLEDENAYRDFSAAIMADYTPSSTLECELVARLTSLLWRLRRAVAIESGLFEMQGRIMRERRKLNERNIPHDALKAFHDLLELYEPDQLAGNEHNIHPYVTNGGSSEYSLDLAVCFLRLGNLNNGFIEMIGRYETRLWRQVAQTILLLNSTRKTPVNSHA